MRVIAGSLRGKKLAPIRGVDIRPTADRIRESIFNIISGHVDQASVLDLFAGTGALGIEALSRGARRALFVDRHREAIATIKKNLHACRLENRARVIRWDIESNLDCIRPSESLFDIVFMDPPYHKTLILSALKNIRPPGILSPNCLIVIEHSIQESLPAALPGFKLNDQRRYGKTLVSFLTCML